MIDTVGSTAKQIQSAKKSFSSRIYDQVTGAHAPVKPAGFSKQQYQPNAKGYGR